MRNARNANGMVVAEYLESFDGVIERVINKLNFSMERV